MNEEKTYRRKTRANLVESLLMSLGGTVISFLGGLGILWAIDRLDSLTWGWALAGFFFTFCVILGFALRWSMWTLLQEDRITRR